MNRKSLKGNIILLIAALLWGFAFVAQDKATVFVEPFTLNATRCIVGALVLLPVCAFFSAKKGEKLIPETKKDRKDLLVAGTVCGTLLCISVNLQQFGIAVYPDGVAVAARSGFITALYVILVPIVGVFAKKKLTPNLFIAALVAVCGLYLLCLSEGFGGIYLGDIITLICAISFTFQIISIDTYAKYVDGVKLSCVQFFVCSFLTSILMFAFENPNWQDIKSALVYILFLGVMSCAVAYTFQIIGQKMAGNPTVASIIMSLESVFAAIGGMLFGDKLTLREILGCVVMFAAIVFAQLPPIKIKK